MDRGTILVVDDSPDNLTISTLFLENFGYRVLTAENGYQGVLRAREVHPDLILMDVMMPVMNGLEATELLKVDDDTAAIPIVILTAHDGPSIRRQAVECGCDALLSKPTPPGKVLHEIERLLGQAHRAPADRDDPAPPATPLRDRG